MIYTKQHNKSEYSKKNRFPSLIFFSTLLFFLFPSCDNGLGSGGSNGGANETVSTPTVNKTPGFYTSNPTITLSCPTTGAKIYYTLDGSTPTETTGILYNGPITLTSSAKLKVVAFKDGATVSSVQSGDYYVMDHTLNAIVRDLRMGHPDTEAAPISGLRTGLVEPTLGSDSTPVYANPTGTGISNFYSFYHDLNDAASQSAKTDNQRFTKVFTMTNSSGEIFTYNNNSFFPIDGEGFGNENGYSHNYSFTVEINQTFRYRGTGSEFFSVLGDDDIWVFINDKLVIDLGGIHGPCSEAVTLNEAKAGELGLTAGEFYSIRIFTAERHTTQSNMKFDSNLQIADSL